MPPLINRYAAIANQLAKMPPELVHKIINDLPIMKLLVLVSTYNVPYIDQCITTHIHLGKVFSAKHLADVKDHFTLYLRIIALDRQPRIPMMLDYDAITFLKLIPPVNIVAVLKANIISNLQAYRQFFPLLDSYSPQPIPRRPYWPMDTAAGLREIFEIIDAAEANINDLKARQLERMARLMEKYPGTLRQRGDWSQEPRKSEQHIIANLRRESTEMRRRQILSRQFKSNSVFAFRQLYLVPYDRLLRLFLKTIQRFPPSSDDNTEKESKHRSHRYPSDLKVVLEGLPEIYSRDALMAMNDEVEERKPMPRTLYNKYSSIGASAAGGTHQPSFSSHKSCAGKVKDVEISRRIAPASEKELDWLEAFLSICNYMASMQEIWTRKETVAEYWQRH